MEPRAPIALVARLTHFELFAALEPFAPVEPFAPLEPVEPVEPLEPLRVGAICASARHMARQVEDLIVWQLSRQVKLEVFAFTERPRVAKDRDFCQQIRDSARSAVRNTAEGFGRFAPREFARFLRIAAASLLETRDHLQDALDCGYLTVEEQNTMVRLTLRALKANVRLQRYLRDCK